MPTSADTAGGSAGPIEGSIGGASVAVVLVMFRPGGDTRSFSLFRDSTVIGRRQECDLRIPLGEVSRKHCRIVKEGGAVRVEDLGSSNGTYHNGKRVREADLSPGDALQVGPVSFVVQIAGEPDEADMRPPSAAGDERPARKSAPDPDALNPTAQSQAGDADALAAVAGAGVGLGAAGDSAAGAIPSPSLSAFDMDAQPAADGAADDDEPLILDPVDSLSPLSDDLAADDDALAEASPPLPVAPVAAAPAARPSKPSKQPTPPADADDDDEFDPMAVLAGGDGGDDDLDAIDFGDLNDPTDDGSPGDSGDIIAFDLDDDPPAQSKP